MKVSYVDLPGQYLQQRQEILDAVDATLRSGRYILGEPVSEFERRFAALCGVQHAVGVANGTDALILALKALDIGPGDEVITAANSWVSSASSIALVGAVPVFADVGDDYNLDPAKLEAAITPRTKAIMPVHLTGRCCDMTAINALAKRHGLAVIEDAAQAAGALFEGKPAGSMSDIACFSLHPLKNLNAAGDAGAVTTHHQHLADRIAQLRNHGLMERNHVAFWAYNSRLDSLQAAILNTKFEKLQAVIERRRHNASRYREQIADLVQCPQPRDNARDTYHLFVIQAERRDELKQFLKEQGISTAIHYPVPIHLQPSSEALGYARGSLPITEAQARRILSLPVHHLLEDEHIDYVASQLRAFYRS
ncbi:DegT/DnrJ/EryC1/StrS family aminotransferase [Acanthopleuribacter pedis]|uniref:DegT/DnrJ/EryC1/StrS family aminotransferase n=1 Tax=Acanthopleuribacter pedis TaxID=442870 RepID=A0A8J7QES5_9BACT|nr:DegT/DnrJ/EryC1/StrS family aminotransferase [Acanthopleuribacter pedis]MBO1317035.1 DegT/DnrJ/EryC1/StrS family aminotransferase [Acanthopleuribacter pedis]